MPPLALLLRASARDPALAARLRPVIWMLLLAHLLASAPRRGGPAPRGRFAPSMPRPRPRLGGHAALARRPPRGRRRRRARRPAAAHPHPRRGPPRRGGPPPG